MLVYNVGFKNSEGQQDETQLDIEKSGLYEVVVELMNLVLSLKDEMDIQEITDIDFVEDTEDGAYTAFAYVDGERENIADEAMFDNAGDAIEAAKSRNWDEVVNDLTGEVVWKREKQSKEKK